MLRFASGTRDEPAAKEIANLVTGDYGRAAKDDASRTPDGIVGPRHEPEPAKAAPAKAAPAKRATARKAPGRNKYEPITLERGVTHDTEFEQWANKVWNFGSGLGAWLLGQAGSHHLGASGPQGRSPVVLAADHGANRKPAIEEQAGHGSPDRPELTGCPGDEDQSAVGGRL